MSNTLSCEAVAHSSFVSGHKLVKWREPLSDLKLVCVFRFTFAHNLQTRGATKNETLKLKFRTTCNDVIFLLLQRHYVVLQHGNHSSSVGASHSKNALPNHLQATLLKIGYCNQYKCFDYDFYTVNLNIFFACSTSTECNEL